VLKENLKPALYAIEKNMLYLKTELINPEYYPCMYILINSMIFIFIKTGKIWD
jgi:hypothetical protein